MLFTTYNNGEPKARVIDPSNDFQLFTWDDWSKLQPLADDDVIKGAGITFRVPEVILLTNYNKIPQPRGHFSRRNLYKRDNLTCQYCGCQPGPANLTIDHVMPRSRGGLTTWENCVLCCVPCNSKKADKTPKEANMKLAKVPKKPRVNLLHSISKPIESWKNFISEAFWETELENDND